MNYAKGSYTVFHHQSIAIRCWNVSRRVCRRAHVRLAHHRPGGSDKPGLGRASSRSRGRAIDFASMPISCRKTSGRKVSSSRRRSRQLSNVAVGGPKTELSINTTADHLARQTGEFYFAIIGEIPRAIDRAA
jgi:hypothetical protein